MSDYAVQPLEPWQMEALAADLQRAARIRELEREVGGDAKGAVGGDE